MMLGGFLLHAFPLSADDNGARIQKSSVRCQLLRLINLYPTNVENWASS
jgi:hypothetical protein